MSSSISKISPFQRETKSSSNTNEVQYDVLATYVVAFPTNFWYSCQTFEKKLCFSKGIHFPLLSSHAIVYETSIRTRIIGNFPITERMLRSIMASGEHLLNHTAPFWLTPWTPPKYSTFLLRQDSAEQTTYIDKANLNSAKATQNSIIIEH